MEPGVFKGERYQGSMVDIVGNHVATVADGRNGDDCSLGTVVVGDHALPATRARDAAVKLAPGLAAIALGVIGY
jgi:hypothetical protein